jgi:hypothetical protein
MNWVMNSSRCRPARRSYATVGSPPQEREVKSLIGGYGSTDRSPGAVTKPSESAVQQPGRPWLTLTRPRKRFWPAATICNDLHAPGCMERVTSQDYVDWLGSGQWKYGSAARVQRPLAADTGAYPKMISSVWTVLMKSFQAVDGKDSSPLSRRLVSRTNTATSLCPTSTHSVPFDFELTLQLRSVAILDIVLPGTFSRALRTTVRVGLHGARAGMDLGTLPGSQWPDQDRNGCPDRSCSLERESPGQARKLGHKTVVKAQ